MKKITFFKKTILAAVIVGMSAFNFPTDKLTNPMPNSRFADVQILQYEVAGFDKLTVKQKKLVYFLAQAGLAGRDIYYDQRFKHNLRIRKTIEQIHKNYEGERSGENWQGFVEFSQNFWFASGLHHHYAQNKFTPKFTKEYFAELISKSPKAKFPVREGKDNQDLISFLSPILFDPSVSAKLVNKAEGADVIATSAVNYYEGLTQKEVEDYYNNVKKAYTSNAPMIGLNSKLMKNEKGEIVEKVWKVGGMYSQSIEKIVYWLTKAVEVAENEHQAKALNLLIEFYKTGDLKKFDEFNIAWVSDTESAIDFINGFIEVYADPLGYKGGYEAVVQITDPITSERIRKISRQAKWFEENSPINDEYKKKHVKGISAKVISVVMEAGDAAPHTPIGINLPNNEWIREQHGSKSVSLENIKNAYNRASAGETLREFCLTQEEIDRSALHGELGGKLHTDMHEVIGHASGQVKPGVKNPNETLKNYASTLEEARADLVALYYLMDAKLVNMGVMPSLEVGKAQYDGYIRNGMMLQLRRVKLGQKLEQDHMRNRQLVAAWAYEKGKADNVIEKKVKDGKTYFVVNDYTKLREIFGAMLREIQRIKSEGDFPVAKALVETYGVNIDQAIHKEVLDRFASMTTAPYFGFVQPKLVPVMTGDKIEDVKIEFPNDFIQQMLEYGDQYGFLPTEN